MKFGFLFVGGNMKEVNTLHILTVAVICFSLLVVTFLTNNPVILGSILITSLIIFYSKKSVDKFKLGLIYFLPFFIVTTAINFLFVGEGRKRLFSIGSKNFTLEALIYGSVLAFKLLLIIYIFMLISLLLDSDRAVSYFSSKMPKSTLILMIAFKLFNIMKQRIISIKEIYSLRGVNFEGKGLKDKVKSYVPILSILLESSLDGSFDIGEAAYIRGFLSSKRSVYERQRFRSEDYLLIVNSLLLIAVYIIYDILGTVKYDVYTDMSIFNALSNSSVFISALTVSISIQLLLSSRRKKWHI
jgi:energy-coupling factor transport system permease protein